MTTQQPASFFSFSALFTQVFGLAAFLGALGWVVKHTVDRLVDSPTIEYEISRVQIGDPKARLWEIKANIVNLSHKNTFRDAKFLFVGRQDEKGNPLDTVFDVNEDHTEMIFYGPAMPEGKRKAKVQIPGAEFEVPVLAPGGRVELVTRYVGKDEPRFVGAPASTGGESFVLVERSVRTFLVANELFILGGLIIFWFLAFCIAAIRARRRATTISEAKEDSQVTGVGIESRG